MSHDLQLQGVRLEDVLEKRRLDQALSAKEFAVLAGVSYSSARGWFRDPGFPVVRGVVFWSDFVEWRRTENGLGHPPTEKTPRVELPQVPPKTAGLPPRAAQILAEAG